MKFDELMAQMAIAERLKCATRHSWTSDGRRESVAEHSWSLMILAYYVKDAFPEICFDRLLQMCLFHDMGEAFTGDIPAFLKTSDHRKQEDLAVAHWLSDFPSSHRAELESLFREMQEQQTPEARLYKALDKMETLIQHNLADLSTWLPLEHEENLQYGKEYTDHDPYLRQLRAVICDISRKKIAADL